MGFWDIFKNEDDNNSHQMHLKSLIQKSLPDLNDQDTIKVTCIAGLLARVAFTDMEIHPNEINYMEKYLIEWGSLTKDESKVILKLALENHKELAGLENHLYCAPLTEMFNVSERFNFLKVLFQIAAADGIVENLEAEEIRVITKSLLLEHKHFVAAKATILEQLGSLKRPSEK